MNTIEISDIQNYLSNLQKSIVKSLEQIDGKTFLQDAWSRDQGMQGQGISCILENGNVFERAGVAYSEVSANNLPGSATAHRADLSGKPWQACGVSLVLHPRNPYVPTVHMNVRFFIANNNEANPIWWFGGGMDLTPYYGFTEDAIHFHQTCKQALEPFGSHLYPQFKTACDEYFYLKHRQEARGIGGIFFDDFNALGFENSFAMLRSAGDHFLKAYLPIVEKRKDLAFGERERDFQAYRRGRYVEFNLLQDRGTLFGLQSGGRTESILMSMPPIVKWGYQYKPAEGSAEAKLYSDFLPAKAWV